MTIFAFINFFVGWGFVYRWMYLFELLKRLGFNRVLRPNPTFEGLVTISRLYYSYYYQWLVAVNFQQILYLNFSFRFGYMVNYILFSLLKKRCVWCWCGHIIIPLIFNSCSFRMTFLGVCLKTIQQSHSETCLLIIQILFFLQ